MSWTDDESIEPKAKRPVGRPVENPFVTAEAEEDFVRCGEAMIRLYYKEGEPNTKHNFVFGPTRALSKTLFWSIIFVYYESQHLLRNNVQGYLHVILTHFDPKVTSDRTSLCKSVGMLERLTANMKHSFELTGDEGRKQAVYRSKYQFVVRLWQLADATSNIS